VTWNTQNSNIPITLGISSIAYGDGIFILVSLNGGVRTSLDGINWTTQVYSYAGADTLEPVSRAAYGNNSWIIAGGSNQSLYMAKNSKSIPKTYHVLTPIEAPVGYTPWIKT
jgi:hypothetical protein